LSRTRGQNRKTPYYPAFLDLAGKRVVVVGGGLIATRKVTGLLECGPSPLVVVAPRASETVEVLAAAGRIEWRSRAYEAGDLHGANLAIAASDDRALNAAVARDARERHVPVLAVDDPATCDFIAPAVVKRGDVVVAVSTGGRSPAMARRTRERVERSLPTYWGDLLDVAAQAREQLGPERRCLDGERWQMALDGEVEQLVAEGATEQAVERLLERVSEDASSPAPAARPGLVSLVGAGPGDPELLTLRALRRLQAADAVVSDRLVGQAILNECPDSAELFDVGKAPGCHVRPQAEINTLLVRLGREGRRVVRLKGGDPFVFGRGGEEALALREAGVPFEVVPGVSAAIAAPAAAGIPVTHRGLASSVTIATGHARAGGTLADDHDWTALAQQRGTLVFLMPLEHLAEIANELIANGRDPAEPAALVRGGTMQGQTQLVASLSQIALRAREAGVSSPATLVVGAVVDLAAVLGPRSSAAVPGGAGPADRLLTATTD
jgi:uroporphyrin-III C-methyltransferase/precorrin-2 dehydrogenase/sirohydrochlorin ferrochelatase